MLLAGTQTHPKSQLPATWVKRIARLLVLAAWADVRSTAFAPIVEAKGNDLILPGNCFRLSMVMHAHQDVTTGPWSRDMVRAVRRQQRFSSKIAARLQQGGARDIYHLHTNALEQYPKFLALMVAKPRMGLVPTMPIDLAWHTHQLFSAKNIAHTVALTGAVLNHDDSDGADSEKRIADGAKAMPET
ncbi:hypothetical protein GGF32_005157 [Allomyces javanicus]|nr:hypothetical protein GGF32_005157 [Allomyces javanicus]